MLGALPKTLTVAGQEYAIRSDFRDVLNIISAFNDPELEPREKLFCCLYILYVDFEMIPDRDYESAYKQALWFVDCGRGDTQRNAPRTLDWEQDEVIIFPAVNKVAGFETRAVDYLHWWTFMGYFMEIGEGVFSNVLHIRGKKARGKKLDKWEQDFWTANKDICQLQVRLSKEEQAAKDKLNALLG